MYFLFERLRISFALDVVEEKKSLIYEHFLDHMTKEKKGKRKEIKRRTFHTTLSKYNTNDWK